MNRRKFLAALAALLIAPRVAKQLGAKEIVIRDDTWDGWTFAEDPYPTRYIMGNNGEWIQIYEIPKSGEYRILHSVPYKRGA